MALSLAAATQVGAITVTVSQIAGYAGSDGEFNVNPVTGTGYAPSVLVAGGFETFCVARDVGISIPGTYDAVVNPNGTYVKQLPASPATTATITKGTAYLYSQFASGVLSGYNYTPGAGRVDKANLLQLALWTLEGQYSYGTLAQDLALNSFLVVAANQFGGGIAGLTAAMLANTSGGFGVGTLNLFYLAGNNAGKPAGTPAQSMLTLLPDGGTTLMLMGLGFSGLALVSRKLRA